MPVWIEGEVTGWKRSPPGHCYFTLRDRTAQLRSVMFRLEAQQLPADPGGHAGPCWDLTIFEKRGFQFVVRELERLAQAARRVAPSGCTPVSRRKAC
jgi:exodeoxyribonuclease VII large subunit